MQRTLMFNMIWMDLTPTSINTYEVRQAKDSPWFTLQATIHWRLDQSIHVDSGSTPGTHGACLPDRNIALATHLFGCSCQKGARSGQQVMKIEQDKSKCRYFKDSSLFLHLYMSKTMPWTCFRMVWVWVLWHITIRPVRVTWMSSPPLVRHVSDLQTYSWGEYPNSWMVFVRENPKKWMMTGGTPKNGNPHLVHVGTSGASCQKKAWPSTIRDTSWSCWTLAAWLFLS